MMPPKRARATTRRRPRPRARRDLTASEGAAATVRTTGTLVQLDLASIASALNVIGRSLAAIALRLDPLRRTGDAERAYFLEGLGLDGKVIAGLLGIKPEAARARLSEGRKAPRARRDSRRR